MKLAAVLLALLAIVASGTAAIGPRLDAPWLDRDAAVEGGALAAPQEPHIRVVIENRDGPRDLELRVTDAEGRARIARTVHLGDGERAEMPLAYPREAFRVVVETARSPLPVGRIQGSVGANGDLSRCDGPYVVAFWFSSTGQGGLPGTGCHAKPEGFDALIAAADAATRAAPGEPVRIPVPGDADEGAFRSSFGAIGFRWRPAETAPGPWGEPRRGPAVTWTSDQGGGGSAGSAPAGLPLLLQSDEVNLSGAPRTLRFDPGAAMAWGHTAFVTAQSRVSAGSSRVGFVEEFAFAPPSGGPGCFLRHALQGQTVAPGQRVADAFCLAGPGMAWVAGPVTERGGFRALPVYGRAVQGAWSVVAEVWLAEGLAYPLEARVLGWGEGQPHRAERFDLDRLRSAGASLAVASPSSPPPPAQPSAPLDALRGPRLTDSARMPFPLAAAVDAALGDPLLAEARAAASRDRAVLAAALLGTRELAQGAGEVVWHLAFAAPAREPVWVTCARPLTTDGAVAAPVTRCTDEDPPATLAAGLALGADAAHLPRSAATWDDALTRWDLLAPDHGGSAVGYAHYAPFGSTRSWASGPQLAVGTHFPLVAPVAPGSGSDKASYAVLDLASGRALASGNGAERVTGLGDVGPGIEPRGALRPEGAGVLGGGTPLLAGAAAVGLAGVLALLLAKGSLGALYTRLARPRLLQQEARARTYQLVADRPGIHASGVARHLGGGHGPAEYHLGVLVREGFLTRVVAKGFRRYFVTGKLPPDEMRAITAMHQRRGADALQLLAQRPGLTVGELAAALGVQPPAASKTVDALAAAGLVERRREGRAVRIFPSPGRGQGPAAAEA